LAGIRRIVAHPRIEQVPEDVQSVGIARLRLQKPGELPDDLPARRVDVQIGDEQARHVSAAAIKASQRARFFR
jgi:hypothetical protein